MHMKKLQQEYLDGRNEQQWQGNWKKKNSKIVKGWTEKVKSELGDNTWQNYGTEAKTS